MKENTKTAHGKNLSRMFFVFVKKKMNKKNTKKYTLIAGLFFSVAVSFSLFFYEKLDTYQTRLSLEVGFSSYSPNGVSSGEILPASCESGLGEGGVAHFSGDTSGDCRLCSDPGAYNYNQVGACLYYPPILTANPNPVPGSDNPSTNVSFSIDSPVQYCRMYINTEDGYASSDPSPGLYMQGPGGSWTHTFPLSQQSGNEGWNWPGGAGNTHHWQMRCVYANGTSSPIADLDIILQPLPPTVSIAPADQTITLGQSANYTVTSSSDTSNIVSDRLIWQPPNYIDYPQLFYGWSYGGSSWTYAGGTPNDTADGNGFTRFAVTNSHSTAYTFTPTQAGIYYFRGGAGANGSWYFSSLPGANLTVLEPIPSTLKICQDSCTSGAVKSERSFTMEMGPSKTVALFACRGTGSCDGDDQLVTGNWTTDSTSPDYSDAVDISSPINSNSTTVTGKAGGVERIDFTDAASTVSTTADVTCVLTLCNSQSANYCSDQRFTIPNNCGGSTPISCTGSRNCDYNWKEVAP
ncbi:MAG: hypothetical protein Q7S04_05040 [Candidatus Moranbacteria bacterium]|nr:hypothetical protein [Candidatus Moranbacteria bacterium]